MDTKRKIYKVAADMFSKKGFEGTSVDDIANKAKVAKGTIYYYFKSKDDIFIGMVDDGIDRLNEILNEKIKKEKTPKKKMEKLLETQLDFYKENAEFYQVLYSEFWRLETKWKMGIDKIKKGHFSLIKEILKEGEKTGDFKKNINVSETISIFSLFFFSGLVWVVLGKNISRKEMHQAINNIFLNGISKKA